MSSSIKAPREIPTGISVSDRDTAVYALRKPTTMAYCLVTGEESGVHVRFGGNRDNLEPDVRQQFAAAVVAVVNATVAPVEAEPHPAEGRTRLSLALEGWMAERKARRARA